MRIACSAIALLAGLAAPVVAADFHVDAIGGNDRNDGLSPAKAWRTLDKVAAESRNKKLRRQGYAAGDRILFRRGQAFSSTGYPVIRVNGTLDQPVTIAAYGDGAPPQLDNDGSGIYDIVFKLDGRHALVRDLEIVRRDPANITEHGLYLAGSGHRVTAVDVSGVGIGIKVEGDTHRIDHCTIHDLSMVIADAAQDNDYGAIGIVLSHAVGVEVDHNTFERLRQPSPDYGVDGSALEIFNGAHSVLFTHNRVHTVAAVTEVGGSVSTERVSDLVYAHNLLIDADSLGYFHNDPTSTYGIDVEQVQFEHNTFSMTAASPVSFLLGFGRRPAVGTFLLRNNVIEQHGSPGLFYNAGGLVHQANLYALQDATLGDADFAFDPSELQAAAGFVDPAAGNFRLQAGSAAIDTGLELGYSSDLDALPMPVGAPDIGAYEYRGN